MSENPVVEAVENETHDEIAQDDFAAGFEGTPTETPELQAEPESPSEEPRYAQLTEDQLSELTSRLQAIDELKAAQEKQFGTAFGKMGDFERRLQQLQSSTPQGQFVEITDEDLQPLRNEYPDLAELNKQVLQNILGKVRGSQPSQDQGSLDEFKAQAKSEAKLEIQTEIATETLDETHPGWREIVGEPGDETTYRKWLGTQPDDYRNRVLNTYNPVVIGNSINRFAEESKQSKRVSTRQNVLAQAAPAKGVGGNAPANSDLDDFLSGFNS